METLKKLKNYLVVLVTGIVAGIFIFLKFKSSEDQNDAIEDAVTQNEIDHVDQDIDALEDDLDSPVGDLTDDDTVDYWKDL